MEDYAEVCIDVASQQGATYAEARFMDYRSRLYTNDGKGIRTHNSYERTFGVRVIVDGMWGFSGALLTDKDSCQNVATRAAKIARAAAAASKRKIKLAPAPTVHAEYRNSYQTNPFQVPISEVEDILSTSVNTLRKESRQIKSATATIAAFDEQKYVETSEKYL